MKLLITYNMDTKKFLFTAAAIAAIFGCNKTDNSQNNGGNEEPKPKPEYADLSLINYDGTPLTKSCTANCYIIRKDGLYSIPLVYGNAIKDGETNVESFYTEGIATDFEDSYGNSFTADSSPYINDHASEQGKSIASAEVLWNDGAASIGNISVTDSELKFEVSDFSACNALIAVKDNDGTILWSWHLWITDADLTPVQITNADGEEFNVMPCNLGWNGWTKDGKPTSPFFQWGRKDPFIANDDPSPYGNIIFRKIESGSQAQYIAHQNPKTFYSCSNSWTTDKYSYFWDSKMSKVNTDQNVTKTIYDPCPAGWSIPQMKTFTKFSLTTTTFADTEAYYTEGETKLYFPLTGRRKYEDANCWFTKGWNACWLSTPSTTPYSWSLLFNKSNKQVNPTVSGEQSNGYSVRPILEK